MIICDRTTDDSQNPVELKLREGSTPSSGTKLTTVLRENFWGMAEPSTSNSIESDFSELEGILKVSPLSSFLSETFFHLLIWKEYSDYTKEIYSMVHYHYINLDLHVQCQDILNTELHLKVCIFVVQVHILVVVLWVLLGEMLLMLSLVTRRLHRLTINWGKKIVCLIVFVAC